MIRTTKQTTANLRQEGIVVALQDLDKTKSVIAGGKGANLGELARIEGIHVPGGFCITTAAYQTVVGETPAVNELLDQLSLLTLSDRQKISALSAAMRQLIKGIAIPQEMQNGITRFLSGSGEKNAWAVRSSATAEDLPHASFAGQQDTYLNIIGKEAILQHISQCWASLFTERAVIYRLQNGFDHRKVHLAVVVQQMVFPQVAGIMFTADPVTGHRKTVSIDASFGLGEALVAGLVSADNYKVRNAQVIDKNIGAKKLAVVAIQQGGTQEQELEAEQQQSQALTDEQIVQLERIGRKIEAHFGSPQDIEWCLAEGTFYIVQSRPITTLFPIPEANDGCNHVYASVGHQQMMTDPMKPLGIAFWQMIAFRPMYTAAGRLFVDVAPQLASPAGQKTVFNTLGKSDPLIKDALQTILERGDFIKVIPDEQKEPGDVTSISALLHSPAIENDPAIPAELIRNNEASVDALRQQLRAKTGTAVFECILEDTGALRTILFDPRGMGVLMTALNASFWINEKMEAWLGEKNAADTLSQSVPNNITSEMGLALLEVADVMRPYPEVIAYLQQVKEENFLEGLAKYKGGVEVCDAITAYLNKYGMRCVGEIDITKTRWSEKPAILVPILLSNVRNFEPGAGQRKFEQGRQEAFKKEQELLHRIQQLPDGEAKAQETKEKISLLRNLIGYREYPKYGKMNRYFVYKQAMMKEVGLLVQAGVLAEAADSYYLTFAELQEAVRTHTVDQELIRQRKEAHHQYEKLTPPRVITSEGEVIAGKYKRENLPAGAIVGLAVSAGVVEGRARVILNMEEADLVEGDILVTTFTDPSWTPLFVSIKGLVTEVGGLMTHGAVIAREYGLPAVVGVENATRLIKDGQRVRIYGTEGYVEIL